MNDRAVVVGALDRRQVAKETDYGLHSNTCCGGGRDVPDGVAVVLMGGHGAKPLRE